MFSLNSVIFIWLYLVSIRFKISFNESELKPGGKNREWYKNIWTLKINGGKVNNVFFVKFLLIKKFQKYKVYR